MNIFDKQKLSALLVKAQGDRTKEKFASDAGVSLPQVSKIIKMETDGPPRPITLQKLASVSQNEVTYEELMMAAGHLSVDTQKLLTVTVNEVYNAIQVILVSSLGVDHPDVVALKNIRNLQSVDKFYRSMDILHKHKSLYPKVYELVGDDLICLPPEPTPPFRAEPVNSIPLNGFVKVPIVGRIPAGSPVIASQYIESYEDVPSSWLNGDSQNYFILKVEGDSMEGAKIFDGDYALIKKSPTCENGQICAVGIMGETPDLYATLKHVYVLDDEYIELVPENSKYPRRKVKRSEVNVFGILKTVHRKY